LHIIIDHIRRQMKKKLLFKVKAPFGKVIGSFRYTISNFRYYGKGSVSENLTYVVKLADLENPLLDARIRGVLS